MERNEITEQVDIAINQWTELQTRQKRPISLTNGAKQAFTQMIVNIEQDPSPYWVIDDYDALQRYAISIIPNILSDMRRGLHNYRSRWTKIEVSSWEILHRISPALDRWCPVPKDI